MRVQHAESREVFLARRPQGTQIAVVRMPTSELVRCHSGELTTFAAVVLTYSYVDRDAGIEWVFHETRRVGDDRPRGGFVELGDTLWAALSRDEHGPYVLRHRSGSF